MFPLKYSLHWQSGTAEQTPETYIKDRGVFGKKRRGEWVSEMVSLVAQCTEIKAVSSLHIRDSLT